MSRTLKRVSWCLEIHHYIFNTTTLKKTVSVSILRWWFQTAAEKKKETVAENCLPQMLKLKRHSCSLLCGKELLFCSTDAFCGMQVNIGGGVLVEKTLLERLHSHCNGPTKFARHLLRGVFTLEEMRGKSLFGKGSNANKNAEVKEALDPVRVNAVIGELLMMPCRFFFSYSCFRFHICVLMLCVCGAESKMWLYHFLSVS